MTFRPGKLACIAVMGSGWLLCSIAGAGAAADSGDSQYLANIEIGTTPGRAIPPTFMGLSHEWGSALRMMGDSQTGINSLYRQLLLNLTAYGSGPIYLRIGGNSTDGTGKPTATTVQPFAELAQAMNVRFSLGVNLATGDVGLATEQAKSYLSLMPAGSVDAIEIGNEPDHYMKNNRRPKTYTMQDYISEFDKWKESITPLLPQGTKFMGQSWDGTPKNNQIIESHEAGALSVFSVHYYASGPLPPPPEDFLLTPNAATKGPLRIVPSVEKAHSLGIALRMGEFNSIFHGGLKGLSDAFQSALWAVDTMFEYAKVGVDGINWHGGGVSGGGPSGYSPFGFTESQANGINTFTSVSVHPLYYGFLFFQAATGNGAKFLPVDVTTKANLKAWATVDASGVPRLVIINKEETMTGTVAVTLAGFGHASVYRLIAPSYKSTTGITFAGQTFDGSSDGKLRGSRTVEMINGAGGTFQIPMPITSAALVIFTK